MKKMEDNIFIDIDCQQNIHSGDRICGDVFLSKKIKEEGRTIVVLSDGMGSGVKANVLASLTASMALNFTTEHKEIEKAAQIIMETLPVCSVRKVSYSTFTIIDIEYDGKISIVEYDNPKALVLRGNKIFDPNWENIEVLGERNKGKQVRFCTFQISKEDRICFWSDGIMQSGMGTNGFPFGWGELNVYKFVQGEVFKNPQISARKLARKVVNMATINDRNIPKDDTSCGVIYFRKPRKLLISTGPPFKEEDDKVLAKKVADFPGKKIIAGGTTTEILARELKRAIKPGLNISDPELPPVSEMEGIDLVTEGILTIGKVARILDDYTDESELGMGPADLVVRTILRSDLIHVLVGTKINVAHQDPNLPVELEIRRTVVKKIVKLLEDKFLKEVVLEFI